MDANVLLDAMTEAEFGAFAEETIPAYAADKIACGQWREDEALELSRKELDALLPQGQATPGHHLFTLRDGSSGDAVGRLWIAEQQRGSGRIAYVYDIAIFPAHQRMGYATRAFEALEDKVRSLGLEGIALHVFGHNRGAHALYEKLGFQATNIHMFKDLAPAKP